MTKKLSKFRIQLNKFKRWTAKKFGKKTKIRRKRKVVAVTQDNPVPIETKIITPKKKGRPELTFTLSEKGKKAIKK